ncbi:hypothetical protein [Mesorhizobium sp. M7A.F.Ca.ET.027.02.1.1]|uniref:hypothetical protein n=1 Tax=Mesorhizobium sp. M7A.F.Ca.ET.027.02.1.1 TaxID=2496655 RepID=UPI00167C1C46|nr:hypothetical protein [Mesorhizobium sp. M7A.F.Ca.ET.027.02.1.1]
MPFIVPPSPIDGDTIVIDERHIRIANIDVPEIGDYKCDAEMRLGLGGEAAAGGVAG